MWALAALGHSTFVEHVRWGHVGSDTAALEPSGDPALPPRLPCQPRRPHFPWFQPDGLPAAPGRALVSRTLRHCMGPSLPPSLGPHASLWRTQAPVKDLRCYRISAPSASPRPSPPGLYLCRRPRRASLCLRWALCASRDSLQGAQLSARPGTGCPPACVGWMSAEWAVNGRPQSPRVPRNGGCFCFVADLASPASLPAQQERK